MTGTKSLSAEGARVGRLTLRVLLPLLLLMPYLIWLLRVPTWSLPKPIEWLPALFVAFVQAAWSAFFAMVAGFALFFAAQGWISPRARHLATIAMLLPNMIPPLFLVLSLLSWVTPFMAFPYGLGAVIVAHVLLNAGLVAVSLERLVLSKLGGMAETAWTLGASRVFFWRRVGWPYLKADLACIFLFVFSLCFTSFSIPLVLGGEKLVTLEVAIYDTIRLEGRWDKAVILAACQSLILFLLAWSLPRPFWPARETTRPLRYFAWPRGKALVFLPALILIGGWLSGLGNAFHTPFGITGPAFVEALLTSVALGLSVGALHLLLFVGVSYVLPSAPLDRFLNGYLAPSPAITGFALLLLPGEGDLVSFAKLSLALTLISFPLLYRWILHSALSALSAQVSVARTLGAGWSMILFEVVWPQVAVPAMRAAGLAALWASGDFALSSIVAGGLNTLPLLMEGLLGGYRIEAAQVLMFPLLLIGLGLYALFVGASRYVIG